MNASELIKERAGLLARIEEINAALPMLENPTMAVRIETRRNLRNSYLLEVTVYTDESLTVKASESSHGGYVTAQDGAELQSCAQAIKLDTLVWLG